MRRGETEEFRHLVWSIVRRIPRGKVSSYGAVARLAGEPAAARRVGNALRSLPDAMDVPWHRVINAAGKISLPGCAGGAAHRQRLMLEMEGVVFGAGEKVDLQRYGWPRHILGGRVHARKKGE